MTEPYRVRPTYIPVSTEMAETMAGPSLFDLWRAGHLPPRLTPEQRQAEVDRRNTEAAERHSAVAGRIDGLLLQVVEHHAPEPMESLGGPYCGGCDGSNGYQDEPAAWPCSTFTRVEEST